MTPNRASAPLLATCPRVQTSDQDAASSAFTGRDPMSDIDARNTTDRRGGGRPRTQLVGREAEMDRIRAFLATARTDGGALLVTGEPGVGKTGLLDAASKEAVGCRHASRPGGRRRVRGRDELLRPEPGPPPAPRRRCRSSRRSIGTPSMSRSASATARPRAGSSCRMRPSCCFARQPRLDRCSSSSTTCPGWTERARAC